MIAALVSSLVFAVLWDKGFAQATTAQSICDSMGVAGNYPNPVDTTCKQYAKCFTSNSVLVGAFYNCSGSTLFNPSVQYCATGYTCTTTTTSTSTSTTTSTTTTPPTTTVTSTTTSTTTPSPTTTVPSTTTSAPISAQSVCNSHGAAGLYPNPDDKLCQQYAKCFENNGSLTGSYYNCTGTTLFDQSLQLCTTGYECGA